MKERNTSLVFLPNTFKCSFPNIFFMMKKLMKYVDMIKDEELKKKVKDFITVPKLSNKLIKCPYSDPEKTPASLNSHHIKIGGNIEHTISVVEISIFLAKHFEKTYNKKINLDYVIAGSILHDWMKMYQYVEKDTGWEDSGCLLDHAVFAAAEMYARGFPEEVIHIVEAHGGDLGQQAARPKTMEAFIVFYADVIDAAFDANFNLGLGKIEIGDEAEV